MPEEERGVANLARRKKHQPRCWDALVLAEDVQTQASETGDDTERQRLLEEAAKVLRKTKDMNCALAFYEVALLVFGNENTPSSMDTSETIGLELMATAANMGLAGAHFFLNPLFSPRYPKGFALGSLYFSSKGGNDQPKARKTRRGCRQWMYMLH